MSKKSHTAGRNLCHSTRGTETTAKEPMPNNPGECSHPSTPVRSGGSSPDHQDEPEKRTEAEGVELMDEWSEEEEFMPTVQEVAKTLATMRSRQQDNDHVQEVGFA